MKRVIRSLLPVLVLAAGLVIAIMLVRTAPKTKKAPAKLEPTLVEVVAAQEKTTRVSVDGMGSVVAARSVVLKAEVPGRVVWLSPNLVQGGRVSTNNLLFKIDDRDYVLAVEQLASNLERARFELAQEQGRARVAEREWKLLGESASTTPEGKALALRQPQLKSAQAALASAQSGLALAKLNVERTKVRAPFNAFVQSESIEVGQLVDKNGVLGTLVGTDEFWVQANIPVADLRWVVQPDAKGQGGAKATVMQKLSEGQVVRREGRVIRLAGDLDPKGRMAQLIVSVKDPMDAEEGQQPLLIGAYDEVKIQGEALERVVVLPRRAIRVGDQVWVMAEDDTLQIKSVQVAFRGQDEVYVSDGLAPGERVIVSRVVSPVVGMPLRSPDAPVEAAPPAQAEL